jgi:hypothetical protein
MLRQVLEAAHRQWVTNVQGRFAPPALTDPAQYRKYLAARQRLATPGAHVSSPPPARPGKVGRGLTGAGAEGTPPAFTALSPGQQQVLLGGAPPLGGLTEVEAALAAGRGPAAARVVRPTPFSATASTKWAAGVTVRQDVFKTGVQDLSTTQIVMPRVKIGSQLVTSMADRDLGPTIEALARQQGLSPQLATRLVTASDAQRAELLRGIGAGLPPAQRRELAGTVDKFFSRVAFKDRLEAGRNPHIGTANAVARQLGSQPGGLSPGRQFTAGSGYAPASHQDVSSTDPAKRRAALGAADADIGRIFHRLEKEAARLGSVHTTAAFDPRPLTRALQLFVDAQMLDLKVRANRSTLVRSTQLVVAELVALLQLYD